MRAPHGRRLIVADDCPEMRWLLRSALGQDFSEVVEGAILEASHAKRGG